LSLRIRSIWTPRSAKRLFRVVKERDRVGARLRRAQLRDGEARMVVDRDV
jgi:hypothetical protein